MQNIVNIIKLSKPLHKIVAIIAILILASSLLDLVSPILSKYIVDEIVAKIQHTGGDVHKLIFFIFLAFGTNLISLILTTASDRLGDHFAGRLRKFLTERFFDKILRLPQNYYDTEVSGRIVHQLNRGIIAIQNFINSGTNFILPTFLQSIFTIVVLAYYNLPIAFFTLLLFPVYLILSYYSTKKWGYYETQKNAIEDANRSRIREVIGNIRLVRGFLQEKNEYKILSNNLTQSNEIYAVQSNTFHIYDFFRGLSLNLVLFAVNLIVFYQTYAGALTIGTMVLILQLVAQARRPLFSMSFILTNIQTAESGSKEYFEIMNLPESESYTKSYKEERIKNPTIEFDHVSFNYENSDLVLKDISFKINAKESVALVGHSGAGKSTIINLILKFYQPTSGDILLKDESYKQLSHQLIRNNISLVFQESELFSSTIRENVAYGKMAATDNEIIKALKLANAYDFVMKLPGALDAQIGERGVRLSGGQKQRIQIARAILKNAPILILDEATSSLDAKSEKEVQDALEYLMKDKLVIVIAHRFSTIQNVDKIIVINNGEVANYGSPQELSRQPGVYQELLHYQIEGNQKLLESFDIY